MSTRSENSLTKFSPPSIDEALWLHRPRLFSLLDRQFSENLRDVVLIEAQAGQGKTLLVAQYLAQHAEPFCWYQCETADNDPLFLLANLLEALRRYDANLNLKHLHYQLKQGELAADHCEEIAALLIEVVKDTKLVLVIDDLHLIDATGPSSRLLANLVRVARPTLRFILLSRHAVQKNIAAALPTDRALHLGNPELAFSHHEIAQYFNTVINRPLTLEAISALQQVTEGWSMGLGLVGLGMPDDGPIALQAWIESQKSRKHSQILDYFFHEVFQRLPSPVSNLLLRLSVLEQIPLKLAEQLSPEGDATTILMDLLRNNLFIRRLTGERQTLVFHHLFRESLRTQARGLLSASEISGLLNQAAEWYHQSGQPEIALRYLLEAQNYPGSEKLLQVIGFELMAGNRLITLENMFLELPEAVLKQHPWFIYFRGLLHLNTAPPRALCEFTQARDMFAMAGDNSGELLCLIELIAFHVTVDGSFNVALPLFNRARDLYQLVEDTLHPHFHLHAASILALAAIFIESNFSLARNFNQTAKHLADQAGTANAKAGALVSELCVSIFSNHFGLCANLAEQAAPILRDPHLAPYWQMVLRVMICDYLYCAGHFDSYHHHSSIVREAATADLALRSIAGPIMRIWDIDIARSQGKARKTRQLLEDGLSQGEIALTDHMRSQFLIYQAMLIAEDQRPEALTVADEAWCLRLRSGGSYHTIECLTAHGITLALMGKSCLASKKLKLAEQLAKGQEQNFLVLPILACRAWLAINDKLVIEASELVKQFMSLLKNYQSEHWYAWYAPMLKQVLVWAVKSSCELDLAREYAARRLSVIITENGRLIPILWVKTLGSLSFELGNGRSLVSGDMTNQHLTTLTHLLSARNYQVYSNLLQQNIWPDSEDKKARANYDVMVMRLRHLFDGTLGKGAGKDYLSQQKGLLSLIHCRVDADEFRREAEEGLRRYNLREYWRADNEFRRAAALYQGDFLAHNQADLEISVVRTNLHRLYVRMMVAWASIKMEWQDYPDVINITEQALRSAATDSELIKLLYQAHIFRNNPQAAQKVLDNYRFALQCNGFDPDDIEEAFEELWANGSHT